MTDPHRTQVDFMVASVKMERVVQKQSEMQYSTVIENRVMLEDRRVRSFASCYLYMRLPGGKNTCNEKNYDGVGKPVRRFTVT
jgi:hypothetical protein